MRLMKMHLALVLYGRAGDLINRRERVRLEREGGDTQP